MPICEIELKELADSSGNRDKLAGLVRATIFRKDPALFGIDTDYRGSGRDRVAHHRRCDEPYPVISDRNVGRRCSLIETINEHGAAGGHEADQHCAVRKPPSKRRLTRILIVQMNAMQVTRQACVKRDIGIGDGFVKAGTRSNFNCFQPIVSGLIVVVHIPIPLV